MRRLLPLLLLLAAACADDGPGSALPLQREPSLVSTGDLGETSVYQEASGRICVRVSPVQLDPQTVCDFALAAPGSTARTAQLRFPGRVDVVALVDRRATEVTLINRTDGFEQLGYSRHAPRRLGSTDLALATFTVLYDRSVEVLSVRAYDGEGDLLPRLLPGKDSDDPCETGPLTTDEDGHVLGPDGTDGPGVPCSGFE